MPKKWILEGYFGAGDSLKSLPLTSLPMIVGREPSAPIPIIRSEMSRNHAEFYQNHDQLMLRDLNSTNGTFINHTKLTGETALHHGDVIHFSSYEVRVLEERENHDVINDGSMTVLNAMPFANKLPTGLAQLQTLLNERAIKAQFQPIVTLAGDLYGYEVLGRGSRQDLPIIPVELFRIAESMPGKAAELSLLMRDCGVEQAFAQSQTTRMFMNTHPSEIQAMPALLKNLAQLRRQYPDMPMVVEVHENAVTDVKQMHEFAHALLDMNMQLAYDDFGAGQARLMEMVDVPVEYVKFDIELIRGLHQAPESKRKMVSALAAMTKAMGIQILAEGVEEEAELALCKDMEFDLIQGYYFSRPLSQLDYKNPL